MRWILLATSFLLVCCAPKVSTLVTQNYGALDYKEDVSVFSLYEKEPTGEVLGTFKVTDNGFSTNCGYDQVIEAGKIEARKIGGNAIKIVKHQTPGFSSTCHRIEGKILRVEKSLISKRETPTTKTLGDVNYSLLHVYRHSGLGPLVGYDLHFGDSVIHRVKNNSWATIKLTKDGYNTLWARTESKSEVPINVEFGNEYFLRCSVVMGALAGRPKLELVGYHTGKAELEALKLKKK